MIDVLSRYFGFTSFRPGQEEVIRTILQGRDCLITMPTGSGKSLCFQLPALIQGGLCVVISPLIALIHDHVATLRARGIRATCLTSTQTPQTQTIIKDHIRQGSVSFLYLSPEKCVTNEIMFLLRQTKIHSFVVDEAHCASLWGHDFRPEYHHIRIYKKCYPTIPFIALTATADAQTRADIIKQLNLTNVWEYHVPAYRPNITMNIRVGEKKNIHLLDFVSSVAQPGIVYCGSRARVNSLCSLLYHHGIACLGYHAGMDAKTRQENDNRFRRNECPIMVATVAYGMGIDKPDIRRVYHYTMPKSIESYYQEIGRAGRDGLPAYAIMTANQGDISLHAHMIRRAGGPMQDYRLMKLRRMRDFVTLPDKERVDFLCRYFE